MEEGTCEAGPNTWGGLFRQERIGKAFQERDQHIQRKNAMKWNTCLGNGPQFIKKRTLLFSCSVVFDSLWPHGLQHTRLPCPWPSPRVCSNPCPSSQWCHPTISSSVIPCSSWTQSFPASGSLPMSQLSASGGQSIGASASASVFPMNIQDWFPLGLAGLISLLSKWLKSLFQHHNLKVLILWHSAFFIIQFSHPYMTIGKP